MLAKVRNAATDESLLKCPKLPEILSLWKDLAGEAEPITWVNTVGRDDRNLANLLEKFMEKDFSHSMMQVDGDPRYRLNQKVLTPFLDPGSILDRTRALTESEWLGEPQKDALRQFIKHYELKGLRFFDGGGQGEPGGADRRVHLILGRSRGRNGFERLKPPGRWRDWP